MLKELMGKGSGKLCLCPQPLHGNFSGVGARKVVIVDGFDIDRYAIACTGFTAEWAYNYTFTCIKEILVVDVKYSFGSEPYLFVFTISVLHNLNCAVCDNLRIKYGIKRVKVVIVTTTSVINLDALNSERIHSF